MRHARKCDSAWAQPHGQDAGGGAGVRAPSPLARTGRAAMETVCAPGSVRVAQIACPRSRWPSRGAAPSGSPSTPATCAWSSGWTIRCAILRFVLRETSADTRDGLWSMTMICSP